MAFGTTEGTIRLLGADYLDITLSAIVYVTASSATVTVTVTDPEGNTATEYDGTVTLYAYDAAGSYASPNVPLSTDGITYPSAAYGVTLTLTAGTWTGDLYFDLPGSITNPITLAGIYDTEVNGYQPSGRAQIDATVPILVFNTTTATVVRGINFSLTIEVQDNAGNILTTAAPNVTLSLSGTGLTTEALNTTTINSGDWVDGVWTSSTMQITGGSDVNVFDATITAIDQGNQADSDTLDISILIAPEGVLKYVRGFDSSTPYTWEEAYSDIQTEALVNDTIDSSVYAGLTYFYAEDMGISSLNIYCQGVLLSGLTATDKIMLSYKMSALPTGESYNFEIRYSTTIPANGSDCRTTGTVFTTITAYDNATDDEITLDMSSISVTGDLFIWAAPKPYIDNSGYPAWTDFSYSRSGGLKILGAYIGVGTHTVNYETDARQFVGTEAESMPGGTWDSVETAAISELATSGYTDISANGRISISDTRYTSSIWVPDYWYEATKSVTVHKYTMPSFTSILKASINFDALGCYYYSDGTYTTKSKIQPTFTIYASKVLPNSYSDLSSIGTIIGEVICRNRIVENKDIEVPANIFNSSAEEDVYIWVLPSTWNLEDPDPGNDSSKYSTATLDINSITLLA